ncbi:MAG: hypothetical protein R2751_14030 [Bacteroidales bacterium]
MNGEKYFIPTAGPWAIPFSGRGRGNRPSDHGHGLSRSKIRYDLFNYLVLVYNDPNGAPVSLVLRATEWVEGFRMGERQFLRLEGLRKGIRITFNSL